MYLGRTKYTVKKKNNFKNALLIRRQTRCLNTQRNWVAPVTITWDSAELRFPRPQLVDESKFNAT